MEEKIKGEETFAEGERRSGEERRIENRRLDERRFAGIGEITPDQRGVHRRSKSKRRENKKRRSN